MKTLFDAAVMKYAIISPCGLYRYWLSRVWDASKRSAGFVMFNPSTADAVVDDPTIKKCMKFAAKWGCGGIEVVNLFAFRSADPAALKKVVDPVGIDNDLHVRTTLEDCSPLVAAWGAGVPKDCRGRIVVVKQIMRSVGVPIMCLKLTADGSPWHPLFVRGDTGLIPYFLEDRP